MKGKKVEIANEMCQSLNIAMFSIGEDYMYSYRENFHTLILSY